MRKLVLVLPVGFLFCFFVFPIALFTYRSIDNRDLAQILPRTSAAVRNWQVGQPISGRMVAGVLTDIRTAVDNSSVGAMARQLNQIVPGFRDIVLRTAKAIQEEPTLDSIPESDLESWLTRRVGDWADVRYWQGLKAHSGIVTLSHYFDAFDLRISEDDGLVSKPADERVFLSAFARTVKISFIVTVICAVFGIPLAYVVANASPTAKSTWMIIILVPFWTSLLVRSTAWLLLLQDTGPINGLMLDLGLISQPIHLVYNELGVYIALSQVLLPFMVLPVLSVMLRINPVYMQAAAIHGATFVASFIRVYLPSAMPGIIAGSTLVFVLALGSFVTPLLVGGAGDQMISYFISFYINESLNWGLAAALSVLLLVVVFVLYLCFYRIIAGGMLMVGAAR